MNRSDNDKPAQSSAFPAPAFETNLEVLKEMIANDQLDIQQLEGQPAWNDWQAACKAGTVTLEQWIDAHVLRSLITEKRQRDWANDTIPIGKTKEDYNADEEYEALLRDGQNNSLERREIHTVIKTLKEPTRYREGSFIRRAYRRAANKIELDSLFKERGKQLEMAARPITLILEQRLKECERKVESVRLQVMPYAYYNNEGFALEMAEKKAEQGKWNARLKDRNLQGLGRLEAKHRVGYLKYELATFALNQKVILKRVEDPILHRRPYQDQIIQAVDARINALEALSKELNQHNNKGLSDDETEKYRAAGLMASIGTELQLLSRTKRRQELKALKEQMAGNRPEVEAAQRELDNIAPKIRKSKDQMRSLMHHMEKRWLVAEEIERAQAQSSSSGSSDVELQLLQIERSFVEINLTIGVNVYRRQHLSERPERLSPEAHEEIRNNDLTEQRLLTEAASKLPIYVQLLEQQVATLMTAQMSQGASEKPINPELVVKVTALFNYQSKLPALQQLMQRDPDLLSTEARNFVADFLKPTEALGQIIAAANRLKVLEGQNSGKEKESTATMHEREALNARLMIDWAEHQLRETNKKMQGSLFLEKISDPKLLHEKIQKLEKELPTAWMPNFTRQELELRKNQLQLANEIVQWKAIHQDQLKLYKLAGRLAWHSGETGEHVELLQGQYNKAKEWAALRDGLYLTWPIDESLEPKVNAVRTELRHFETATKFTGETISRDSTNRQLESNLVKLVEKLFEYAKIWSKLQVARADFAMEMQLTPLENRLEAVEKQLAEWASFKTPIRELEKVAKEIRVRLHGLAKSIEECRDQLIDMGQRQNRNRPDWRAARIAIDTVQKEIDGKLKTEMEEGSADIPTASATWRIADLEKAMRSIYMAQIRQDAEALQKRMDDVISILALKVRDPDTIDRISRFKKELDNQVEKLMLLQKSLKDIQAGEEHLQSPLLRDFDAQCKALATDLNELHTMVNGYELACVKQVGPNFKDWTEKIGKNQAERIGQLVERGVIKESTIEDLKDVKKLPLALCICNEEGKMQFAVWESEEEPPTVYKLDDKQRSQVLKVLKNQKLSCNLGDVRNLTIHPAQQGLSVPKLVKKLSFNKK